jgi:Asp-tRNA(Asn)/Glu-tRNA(Gln) amidotransferase A subunit family amidase
VRTFQPSEVDGLLVELLRDAGAIPFVRTNVPQCLMVPESDNVIWGQAKNP